MSLHIRKASLDDATEIADIYNQYLGSATLHLLPASTEDYEKVLSSLKEREEMWVMKKEDQLIGWSILKYYSQKEGYQYACETSTFFDKKFVGNGYGKKLKKHILERAKALGFRYVLARIMSENKTSIQFNLSLGYKIVGEQKAIGWVKDQPKSVTIMEKHL